MSCIFIFLMLFLHVTMVTCLLLLLQLLDRPKTSAPKVSDCKVKNGGQLPPPNMEYFIRKRMTPLKWTRPYNFSGFVLEDNSVVFIGTKKYEETLRRSFLNYLQGGTEDVDDFVARNFSKEKEKAEEAEVGGIVKANTKDVAQQKLENFKNTPTMVTVTNATAAGDITTTITAAPVADKAGSSFDGEDGGFSHSVRTEPSIEILEVDNYITFTQRAQEVDVGINETSQATSEQPASYFYLSSSSDDEELPKVQVTGRSMLPLKQLHKVAGTSDSRRYDKEHVVKEHVVKEHVVKEHVVVSGEDPNRTSQVTSGVSEGGAVVSDSSLQTGLPEECPICGVVFPPGYVRHSTCFGINL